MSASGMRAALAAVAAAILTLKAAPAGAIRASGRDAGAGAASAASSASASVLPHEEILGDGFWSPRRPLPPVEVTPRFEGYGSRVAVDMTVFNPTAESDDAPAASTGIATEDWSDKYWVGELQARPRFEWYNVRWSEVKHLLPTDIGHVLHIGCGTSRWPREMADEGLTDVLHVDGSEILVEELQRRDPDLFFQAMDATSLDFPDGVFGAVVEKGLLDALMLDSRAAAVKALHELHRVLKPGGVLLSVTMYGGPGQEGPYLGEAPWESLTFSQPPAIGSAAHPAREPTEEGGGAIAEGLYVCKKKPGPKTSVPVGGAHLATRSKSTGGTPPLKNETERQ